MIMPLDKNAIYKPFMPRKRHTRRLSLRLFPACVICAAHIAGCVSVPEYNRPRTYSSDELARQLYENPRGSAVDPRYRDNDSYYVPPYGSGYPRQPQYPQYPQNQYPPDNDSEYYYPLYLDY